MTEEQRRETIKEWRSENRERIRKQRRERARSEALASLESMKQLDANVYVMRAHDGREYIVGGRRR